MLVSTPYLVSTVIILQIGGLLFRLCGSIPPVVIMDATSLAFRKKLDIWKIAVGATPESKLELRSGR